MKWIGFLLIIAGCSGIGFTCVADYTKRLVSLEQLVKMIGYISNDIEVHNIPLAEAIRRCENRMEGNYKKFLHLVSEKMESFSGEDIALIWKNEAPLLRCELAKRDYELFLNCMDQTGFMDAKAQKQVLNEYQNMLKQLMEELAKKKEDTCKLYRTIGILSGLFLCVLFI